MPPEGVRETEKAYVVSVTPDVCLTPMGATAVPVPYPIVGRFDNVVLLAKSVRMCGRPTFTTASQVTRVMGDEAGTGGGVKSGVNMSVCESVTASSTVRAEGNRVLRHGDVLKMNNGNTLGKVIFMPGLGPVIFGEPSGGGNPVGRVFKWGFNFAVGEFEWAIDTAKSIKSSAEQMVDPTTMAKFFLGYYHYKAFGLGKAVASDPVGFGKELAKPYTEAYEKGGWARVLGRIYPDVGLAVAGVAEARAARAAKAAAEAARAAEAAAEAARAAKAAAQAGEVDQAARAAEAAAEAARAAEAAAEAARTPAAEPAGRDGLSVTGAGDTQRMPPPPIIIADEADPLIQNAMQIKPVQGLRDIVIHANSQGFGINSNGRGIPISVRDLANQVRTFGPPPPGGYRLIGCEAGADVAGAAQQLANELGAPVWAPTEKAWVHPDGKISSGSSAGSYTGRFYEFRPANSPAVAPTHLDR